MTLRVTFLDRDEALAVCSKIKAKHPDILDRRPDGLYRYLVSSPDMARALFDYLACDRVAAAWAAKRGPGARIWIGCASSRSSMETNPRRMSPHLVLDWFNTKQWSAKNAKRYPFRNRNIIHDSIWGIC